jgi:DNA-binding response OmpR family regulator
MRILLIEDDQQAASYLLKGLAESGYVVEHALDGEQGLQLALSEQYDVLVVDRMLPKRDGLDGETGMPCSDIIYRGRGWIRWRDWHALF